MPAPRADDVANAAGCVAVAIVGLAVVAFAFVVSLPFLVLVFRR
jgi:hypothetical protein